MRTESILGNQSGLALVLTLLFVSLLVAMTVQLMATIDRQSFGAVAQREQVRLDAMVLGGLHLARAALVADQLENEVDSPHDRWAGLEQLAGHPRGAQAHHAHRAGRHHGARRGCR